MNTRADGTGTAYADEAAYSMTSEVSVTLYAFWSTGDYTVNYSGNDSTGGTVPDTCTWSYNSTAPLPHKAA